MIKRYNTFINEGSDHKLFFSLKSIPFDEFSTWQKLDTDNILSLSRRDSSYITKQFKLMWKKHSTSSICTGEYGESLIIHTALFDVSVYYYPDDWYLVSFVGYEKSPFPVDGYKYLCDQLDGVIECIKENLKLC